MNPTSNDLRLLTPAEIDAVAGGTFGIAYSHNGVPPISVGPGVVASTSGHGSTAFALVVTAGGFVSSVSSASVTGNGSATASSTVISF